MKLKNLCYAAFVAVAAVAFVIASASPSEAAKKKKAAAAPPQYSAWCSLYQQPVCAMKGKQKFTYANACFAGNDNAKVVKQGACKAPKAAKAKKAGKKKMAKPSKKKKPAKKMKK